MTVQGASSIIARPEFSMLPQLGAGGRAPRPRKLRAASFSAVVERLSVTWTTKGEVRFGRMCRHRMRMTSQTAQRLGLRGIAMLVEGFRADVTIFDPDTVIDRSTYESPWEAPAGIAYVMVGGTIVAEGGRHTGERPGVCLRRGRPLLR